MSIKHCYSTLFFSLILIVSPALRAKCWPAEKIPPTISAKLKLKKVERSKPCIIIADVKSFDIVDAHLQELNPAYFSNLSSIKIKVNRSCEKLQLNSKLLLQMNCNDKNTPEEKFILFSEIKKKGSLDK